MRLSAFLTQSGISQEAFASEIGVKQATVSRYISGKKLPSVAVAARIKAATDGAVGIEDFPELLSKVGRLASAARKASRR